MKTRTTAVRAHPAAVGLLGTGAVSFLVAGVMAAAPATADKGGSSGAPPGSNATIKIQSAVVDDDVSNQPHVSCPFYVSLYNFDSGQGVSNKATVLFEAQPPSGHGDVLTPSLGDGTFTFTGANASEQYSFSKSTLDTLTLQPNQGYHVKVTVSVTTTGTTKPGNGNGKANGLNKATVKHKVFWLTCNQTPPPVTPVPSSTPPTSSTVTPTTGGSSAPAAAVVTPKPSTSVLGEKVTRKPPAAKPKATKVTRLPFTGVSSRTLGVYVPAALGFILTGAGLLGITRRRPIVR